jgi:hypothetical protein
MRLQDNRSASFKQEKSASFRSASFKQGKSAWFEQAKRGASPVAVTAEIGIASGDLSTFRLLERASSPQGEGMSARNVIAHAQNESQKDLKRLPERERRHLKFQDDGRQPQIHHDNKQASTARLGYERVIIRLSLLPLPTHALYLGLLLNDGVPLR